MGSFQSCTAKKRQSYHSTHDTLKMQSGKIEAPDNGQQKPDDADNKQLFVKLNPATTAIGAVTAGVGTPSYIPPRDAPQGGDLKTTAQAPQGNHLQAVPHQRKASDCATPQRTAYRNAEARGPSTAGRKRHESREEIVKRCLDQIKQISSMGESVSIADSEKALPDGDESMSPFANVSLARVPNSDIQPNREKFVTENATNGGARTQRSATQTRVTQQQPAEVEEQCIDEDGLEVRAFRNMEFPANHFSKYLQNVPVVKV